MSTIQSISCPPRGITLIKPNARYAGRLFPVYQIPYFRASHLDASTPCKFQQHKLQRSLTYSAPKNERCVSLRAFARKGDPISNNEEVLWRATDDFRRELTVQGLLKEYKKGRQLSESGGGGNFFGGGGNFFGGGGNFFRGGGGGHHSGDSDGEGFAEQCHEFLQVIMATIGVMILYILFTSTSELTRLTRDYIKYLNGAKPSQRMIRYMEMLRNIYECITWKESVQ